VVRILKVFEEVILVGKKRKKIKAKIDTGAWRTAIDKKLVKELGFKRSGEKKTVKSALGRKEREIYNATIILSGKKIDTEIFSSERKDMKYPAIIGRKDLKGFLIDLR